MLTTVVSAIFVVASAEYAIGEFAPKANPLADALSSIQTSRQGLRLEHQRQHMIRMTAATKSFKLVGKVKVAKVPPPPTPPAGTANPPPVNVPLPSPGTSQAIAYQLLPQFGFNAKQQYPCLDQLWMNESGWQVTAYNASGAYGIPQALPGSKMASAGADWQTNPATQIKWGLGYIQGRYGTPCNAWAYWQGHGYY